MPSIGTSLSAVCISGAKLRHDFGKINQSDAATLVACEEALRENWHDALDEVAHTALSLATDPRRRPVAKAVTALGVEYCLERKLCQPRELSQAAVLLLKPKRLRGRRSRANERQAVLDCKRALPEASQREIARRAHVPESTLRWWLETDVDFRAAYESHAGAR